VLLDVQGLWGGRNLWIDEDGNATAQLVTPGQGGGPGLHEKRYRRQIPAEDLAEAERLVGAHRFLDLRLSPRPGVPDESHPEIAVIAKDGRHAAVMKWQGEKQPRFDPLYGHLLAVFRDTVGGELVHEGPFDWEWHPEGFPAPSEIRQWR
jgi:hypothetical protein